MNYRHIYHAGNFADVFKHVLLTRILVYLMRKPAPLRYIDTHAGLGWYDLGSDEAQRTGEWRSGIGRLTLKATPSDLRDLLGPYLEVVGSRNDEDRPWTYPGSPGLAQHLLRPDDRLLVCERHPEDAERLRQAMGRDKRSKVVMMDGYTALKASVPPPERRGLVLIDPPFEERDEFEALGDAVASAYRKWATGTFALWYPIKHPEPVVAFSKRMRMLKDAKICQIEMAQPFEQSRPALRGCGLLVINPPYVLEDEASRLLPFLTAVLSGSHAPPLRWRLVEPVHPSLF